MYFLYDGLNRFVGRYATKQGLKIAIGKRRIKLLTISDDNQTNLIYTSRLITTVRSDI